MSPSAVLRYPQHMLEPSELLSFIELPVFTRSWRSLGLDDDDLLTLQVMVCADPSKADVIRGTGGLRKMRMAREAGGKSGGYRILYAFFEEFGKVLLVAVFAKNQRVDISDAEKAAAKTLLNSIGNESARSHNPTGSHPEIN